MRYKDGIQKLSAKSGEKWYSQLPDSKPLSIKAELDIVQSLKAEAENLLDSESKLYRKLKENHQSRDFQWIKKILHAGTLADKISAHTLLLEDSAVYNLHSLDTLISMVNTKGKRECLMAMDALQDLFIGQLLIEDRKLKPFNEQPLNSLKDLTSGNASKKTLLLLWLFEEKLKLMYKKFLRNIVAVSHDTIEKTKMKAVSVLSKLLRNNCEEEQFLLESLTNKVGDPVPKVGSHACYQLGALLKDHSMMKSIVVQEVERLLFRPNVADRAKYYSLCFLNQIILCHEEFKLANHLISMYFGQFKSFINKGEVDTKLMSALLTGVTRAYPYAKLKDNVITEQLDAMYRLVHMVSFNISVQALMLIFQVLDSSHSISDRFYCVLYRKLLDPALNSSSRQSCFLNLVYKALKKDVAVIRVKTFVKRLLQVALYQDPNLQCGILVVISELNKLHPDLLEVKRVFESGSDSEEAYEDVPDEDEVKSNPIKDDPDAKPPLQSSWVHKRIKKKSTKGNSNKLNSTYNLDCRNPLHAKTETEHFWELLFLKHSFHPSVSLFAHQASNSTPIKYSGDPLQDFTTSRFLDRFVYRNPKKLSESFYSDPKNKVFGKRKLMDCELLKLPVTSDQYLKQDEDRIPVEERFMYKYLNSRPTQDKSRKGEDDSDIESVCSEDFEEMLDKVIKPDDESSGDVLNFAKELGLNKQKKGVKRKAGNSGDEDDDDSMSDGEEDFEDDLEFDDNEFEDLDDEEFQMDEEDFVGEGPSTSQKKGKKGRQSTGLSDGMFADAEEFTALLEEGNHSAWDGTTEAYKQNDKTSAKQLKWEMDRDRFIRGKRNGKFHKRKSKKQKKM